MKDLILTPEQKKEAEEKKQKEIDEKAKKFIEDVNELSKKYGLTFLPVLQTDQSKIEAVIRVVKINQ